MDKKDKKKVQQLMHSVGLNHGLTAQQIKEIVESPFEFTAETIKELDLDNVTTEEELSEIKTNFNYRALGKLYLHFPLLARRIKQRKNILNLNKKNGKS